MTALKQSPEIMAIAKSLGVDIDSSVTFDPKTAIQKVATQLNGGEVTFSGEDAEFGSFLRHIIGRKADRSVRKVAKVVGKVAAVASFAVPGVGPLIGGSALAAMTAADKLLGDPKVKNAAQLVSNTKALAAMGNVPARRGAAALAAVAQIRQATGAKPGQAVIKPKPTPAVPKPKPPVINAAAYVQTVPRTQVKALAVQAVATAPKKSFWQKFKDLFHS